MTIVDEMIAEFDKKCAEKGHGWAQWPDQAGIQYCQACGKTRATPPTTNSEKDNP